MLLYAGKVVGFLLGLFFFAAIIYGINRLKDRVIRDIPGLAVVEESVGRAVEMGRPVHDCPGLGGLHDIYAQQTIAGLSMIGYVARLCASRGAKLIVTIPRDHVLPAAEQIVREAYVRENAIEHWSPDIVRFLPNQNALMAYSMGMFEREQIKANILFGAYYWEAIVLADHGASVGAINVCGSATQSQLPTLVASCDYTMIGDEIFAASSIISGDKAQIGSIAGQDIVKIAIMAFMIMAVLAALLGSNLIVNIINL